MIDKIVCDLALDYSEEIHNSKYCSGDVYGDDDIVAAFTAGYTKAQEWISVESAPLDKEVLVRSSAGICVAIQWSDNDGWMCQCEYLCNVTHWREI